MQLVVVVELKGYSKTGVRVIELFVGLFNQERVARI